MTATPAPSAASGWGASSRSMPRQPSAPPAAATITAWPSAAMSSIEWWPKGWSSSAGLAA